jgi:hypothetical protein
MSLTGIAFVLAYLFGLLKTFTTDPRWGFYTYIGAFYLHPPMRWWGAGLPDLRWSLTAAVATLIALPSASSLKNQTPWFSHTVTKLAVFYVVWMWIQLPWASARHFDGLILFTKYIVLLYLMYRLIRDEQGLVGFAYAHVAGCLYFGLLAYQAAGHGRLEGVGGPGVSDSNTLGMHMSTGLLFAGSLILTQKGWRRWLVMLAVPLIANGVVQTESRGAFLGAVCGGIVYLMFSPKIHRKTIMALAALSLVALVAYTPLEYWQRIGTISEAARDEERADKSARSRLVIIQAQWQMFLDHPFGLGFDTTTELSPVYLDTTWLTAQGGRASHNTLMTIVTDQGIPGIFLAFFGVLAVLRLGLRAKRVAQTGTNIVLSSMLAAICGSLTVAFVAGLFANYMKAEIQLWCIGLLVAGLQIGHSLQRSEPKHGHAAREISHHT